MGNCLVPHRLATLPVPVVTLPPIVMETQVMLPSQTKELHIMQGTHSVSWSKHHARTHSGCLAASCQGLYTRFTLILIASHSNMWPGNEAISSIASFPGTQTRGLGTRLYATESLTWEQGYATDSLIPRHSNTWPGEQGYATDSLIPRHSNTWSGNKAMLLIASFPGTQTLKHVAWEQGYATECLS